MSGLESTRKADGPGPSACYAVPEAPSSTSVAFSRKPGREPHHVFAAAVSSKAWKISKNAAERFCAAGAACTGYCWNPTGNTLFYASSKLRDMRPRGKADALPTGWACYAARRRTVAAVAPALLEGGGARGARPARKGRLRGKGK